MNIFETCNLINLKNAIAAVLMLTVMLNGDRVSADLQASRFPLSLSDAQCVTSNGRPVHATVLRLIPGKQVKIRIQSNGFTPVIWLQPYISYEDNPALPPVDLRWAFKNSYVVGNASTGVAELTINGPDEEMIVIFAVSVEEVSPRSNEYEMLVRTMSSGQPPRPSGDDQSGNRIAALENQIRFLEDQIDRAHRNAQDCDAEARLATQEQRYTHAASMRGMSVEFHHQAAEFACEKLQLEQELRKLKA